MIQPSRYNPTNLNGGPMTLDFKPGNPGSAQAIADGCTCPVIDNARGRGWMGGIRDERGETIFVVNVNCPLHGGKIG